MIKTFMLIAALLPAYLCAAPLTGLQTLDRVVAEHIRWVYREYGFTPRGKGLGAPWDQVRTIELAFHGNQKLTIEQVRPIYLRCVTDLLLRVNASKELRPMLHNYPFTFKNLEYSLSFGNYEMYAPKDGFVHMVMNSRGRIGYEIGYANEEEFMNMPRESYEEAMKLIEKADAASR